ncbi:MAG: prepilin-type N-terminal cleavage/methylation domain-containing protein [Hydrogenovibrio sp.]|uniref:prepilin-type N-terminal cleavage/methylation domain-containing protein n=1 Tax=Hydrogenovibrio sp. TaxID=2065821 RepID=UPI00286FE02F|nr:prepilin-type N-terminal cleavage/methylation domain-containing protein [Hydrogenovibrio sp.]MDR9498566.1 prepilin-type N-terminal cleavage/methylation domain-containing protein [Hydrogenovibrio sp.]
MHSETNKGFTLIEISLVLVIIGLLLGGVLKGSEMIENAKINRVMSDQEEVRVIMYAFQDRHNALPGDFENADEVLNLNGVNGNGDSIIEGAWNSTNNADESRKMWLHMRASGFISGNTTTYTQPQNSFDGIIGVETDTFGMQGHIICMSNVPRDVAIGIDSKHDNGRTQDGRIRSGNTDTGSNAIPALTNERVFICFAE